MEITSIQNVIQLLEETPYARWEDKEHLMVRCPICGDSKKHHDGAHCSIWVRNNEPLVYHCWICEDAGLVDRQFLVDKEIGDIDSTMQLEQFNRANSRRSASTKRTKNGQVQNVEVPVIKEHHMNKVEYLRNRLGINFKLDQLEALRVVTSIKDFLEINKIEVNKKYEWCLEQLERDYVGFLSRSKNFIIFRSINPNSKFRYINYKVFEHIVDAEKFYTIPSQPDIMDNDVTLHITEGIFDILSVAMNMGEKRKGTHIYSAVCGSGFPRVLEFFLRKGFIGNLTVNIYSDTDKKPGFYNNLLYLKGWYKDIKIIYNSYPGEKDFGVPSDKICAQEVKLLRR